MFDSHSEDTDKSSKIGTTLGIDINLNDKNSIGIKANGNFMYGPGLIVTNTDVKDASTLNSQYSILSESKYYHQVTNRINSNFNYTYEDENIQKFSVDLDIGTFDGNSKNFQPNKYYSVQGLLDSVVNYKSTSIRDIDLCAASLNYQHILWRGTIYMGAKNSNVSSVNDYNLFNVEDEQETLDASSSNAFDFKENILSGFLQYNVKFSDNLSANAGLRTEYTHSEGHLYPVAGSLENDSLVKRNYTDFFPSLSFNYKLSDDQNLSLSYGKRIGRPAYSDMNPIDQPLDVLSSWSGNPYLLPQKTYRINARYNYKNSVIGISYSITKDYIVQVTDTIDTEYIVTSPQNLGQQNYLGLSFTQTLKPLKGWNIVFTGRGYHLTNKMDFDADRYFNRDRWAYALNIHSDFPLFWNMKAEVFGIFNSKRLGSSTEVLMANNQVDMAFSKKLFKDKGVVKLAVTDIFWGSNWDNDNEFTGYKSQNYGYAESRQVKLNFSYKFGSNGIKRKDRASNVESELNRF